MSALAELERELTAAENELDEILGWEHRSVAEEQKVFTLREYIQKLNRKINKEISRVQIPLIEVEP